MKPLHKSWTFWFNLAVLAAALPEVQAVVPTEAHRFLLAFVAFGNLALRLRTDSPVALPGRG